MTRNRMWVEDNMKIKVEVSLGNNRANKILGNGIFRCVQNVIWYLHKNPETLNSYTHVYECILINTKYDMVLYLQGYEYLS